MILFAVAMALAAPGAKPEPAAILVGSEIFVMDDSSGSGARQVPVSSLHGPFRVIGSDPSGTLLQIQSAKGSFWTMATSVNRGRAPLPLPVLSPCRKEHVGATRSSCGSAKPR